MLSGVEGDLKLEDEGRKDRGGSDESHMSRSEVNSLPIVSCRPLNSDSGEPQIIKSPHVQPFSTDPDPTLS